jgi:phosphogluconate dehydratase
LQDGDVVRLCGPRGLLEVVDVDLDSREATAPPPPPIGTGRELFAFMRATADNAEHGASAMLHAMEPIL